MELFAAYRDFIPDFQEFLAVLTTPAPEYIRVNTLRIDTAALRQKLLDVNLAVSDSPYLSYILQWNNTLSSGSTLPYALGYYHPQDLSSAIAAEVLGPRPGDCVLDLCAAPGSKTTQMAMLMQNSGLIVANDLTASRLATLSGNVKRLGVINTVSCAYQGEEFPRRIKFNRILVDAPCSGEGNVRLSKEKAIKPRRTPRHLTHPQERMLLRAYELLLPGGLLLYSTCTYNPRENEAVVNRLLQSSDAKIIRPEINLPSEPGLITWGEQQFSPALKNCLRLYPHRFPGGGFFLALVKKPV